MQGVFAKNTNNILFSTKLFCENAVPSNMLQLAMIAQIRYVFLFVKIWI